ncbi:trypsin-like serine protease [Streptomyces polygonati]|uniref:Trypsin-like serine protease n=1 Tax=Streptomyces polygonati TaxID=1617087 RepID=A0ABV8HUA0_9ACTN
MRALRRGGRRRYRPRVVAPLTALVLCAAGLALAAPAQAGTGTGTGTGTSTATGTVTSPSPSPGTAKPRLIGGRPAESLFKPWIVQLVYQPGTPGAGFCAGTAISPTKILTAGHCVAGRDWTKNGEVVVGSATAGPSASSTEMTVHAQWLAPGYKPTASGLTIDNDLAILTLDRPVSSYYNDFPPQSASIGSGAGPGPVTVYGWGNTDSAVGSSNQGVSLQRIDVAGVPDQTCGDALATATGDPLAFVAGHMLCVGAGGTGDDTTGKTACVGDEGDPVVSQYGALVGVISYLGVRTATQDCNVPGTYDVVTSLGNYIADMATQMSDSDVTRDGKADILARTPAGESYLYASTGTGYKSRVPAPISFSNYDTVVQDDFDRDGYQDFVLRAKGTGNVFLARRTVDGATYKYTQIGSHWGAVKAIISRSDLGYWEQFPQLLVEDSAGRVWTYGRVGDAGTFGPPFTTQGNWSQYDTVVGHGDFNGDGISDVLARDPKTGDLYLLRGANGNEYIRYQPPVLISGGWNGYDKLIAPGDYDGDGHPDLLARVPSGSLYLFKGTGKTGSATLAAPVRIGTGWNMYSGLS